MSCDRFTNVEPSSRGAVVGVTTPQPLDRLVNDGGRSVQVRIANTENNDVRAAIARSARFIVCQPGVGAFTSDSLYERRELHIFAGRIVEPGQSDNTLSRCLQPTASTSA